MTLERDEESSWAEEIRRRIEELEAGLVQPIPWAEVRRQLLEDMDDAAER